LQVLTEDMEEKWKRERERAWQRKREEEQFICIIVTSVLCVAFACRPVCESASTVRVKHIRLPRLLANGR